MIIALSGRRIDAANAPRGVFPLLRRDEVRARIRQLFAERTPRALVCSAACGADLLALEVAGELGIQRRVILPFARDEFRKSSVVDRPGDWGPLFDRICDEVNAAGNLVVLPDAGTGDAAYAAANQAILDQAGRLAGTDGQPGTSPPVEVVLVWEGHARNGSDATAAFGQMARDRRLPVFEISTRLDSDATYSDICFVIVPFGKKPVGSREVDFDRIYTEIFDPAIRATPLPEGGHLVPRRTDKDYFSGSLSVEMFRYIEYSRMALVDISGLNANVFLELGVRYRARETGTAIFRQLDAPIPFDVKDIHVFDYEFDSADKVAAAREHITRVLKESLEQNRIDSPVRIALDTRRQSPGQLEALLREAEQALLNGDLPTAETRYAAAIQQDRSNPELHLRRGIVLKLRGKWSEAVAQFELARVYAPTSADAYREKGIAENKLYNANKKPAGMPSGEQSLRRAIDLNPADIDALASLGGILKREDRLQESLEMYRRAREHSGGQSYPLLNELKLRACVEGKLELDDGWRRMLRRAAVPLKTQVANNPPYNVPWSFFDLAEINLFLGQKDEFFRLMELGLDYCRHDWEVETFLGSLGLLEKHAIPLEGLAEALARLRSARQSMLAHT